MGLGVVVVVSDGHSWVDGIVAVETGKGADQVSSPLGCGSEIGTDLIEGGLEGADLIESLVLGARGALGGYQLALVRRGAIFIPSMNLDGDVGGGVKTPADDAEPGSFIVQLGVGILVDNVGVFEVHFGGVFRNPADGKGGAFVGQIDLTPGGVSADGRQAGVVIAS